jgi:hypothetical protein
MNIEAFADDLHQRLVAAAATGSPEIQQAAERLSVALEPAIHLGFLAALSEAAAEINAELTDGTTVELRLAGRSPSFVVTAAPQAPEDALEPPPAPTDDADDVTVARISLRLPEALKARAEERAARAGQSLNSWLVAAVRAAAEGQARAGHSRSPKRIQGWVR